MKAKFLTIALLLMVLAGPLFSQDESLKKPQDEAQPLTPGKQTEAPPEVTSEGLLSSTLPEDIATASYYELVAWCQELGLDDSGSRKDLQARLYAHYKLTAEAEKKKTGKNISVRSAKESEYFTVEEMSEKYVTLRGNVAVVLTDTESGAVQEIHAQSLTYNQTRNIVTAKGGVEYRILNGSNTEVFVGDSLSFDLNTWEGVFYDGQTARPQKRGNQNVTFYYQGDTISRLENETVVLENGSFTSCDMLEAPHYQMRANKVWILAPGEWALENAVLSVGRVPIFYFPVFFFPGDELFFNPALGYDARTGTFLQTTTYLIGKKKQSTDNTLSFMQLTEGNDAGYDLELKGLFLRKIPGNKGAEKQTGSLKLELDGYSRLGAFLGLAGDFPPLASFQLGIAESRNLFLVLDPITETYIYSPYYISDGTETSIWNTSSIFGLTVPFRYGFKGTFSGSADFGSLTAKLEYYSDPFFTRDFYNRSEGIQFTNDLQTLLNPPNQQTAAQTNLSWDLSGKADFARLFALQGQSLSIPNLNLKFTWQSKETPSTAGTPLSVDPGRIFFCPSTLVAPNISFVISRDLLRYSSTQAAANLNPAPKPPATSPSSTGRTPTGTAGGGTPPSSPGATTPGTTSGTTPGAASPDTTAPGATSAGGTTGTSAGAPPSTGTTPRVDPGKGFHPPIPPAPVKAKEGEVKPRDRFAFRVPARRVDQPAGAREMENAASLSYLVQPNATLQQTFDSSAWQTQQDVDFRLLYGTFETGATGQLTGSLSLLDRLLATSLSLAANGTYRQRYNISSTYTPDQVAALLLSDMLQDQFALRTIFQASVQPLQAVPVFSGSNVSYRLNFRLYQLNLTGTDPLNPVVSELGPAWDKTSVTEHSLQGTVSLKALDAVDTLTLTAQLPPFDPSVTGGLDFTLWLFKTRVQAGASSLADVWKPQPLIVTETIQFTKDANVSEELQFDLVTNLLDKSTSQLKLWPFTASFIAERKIPVDYLGVAQGTEEKFLPSQLRMGLDYSIVSLLLWKNRIKLDGSVRSNWNLNLQKFTDNSFDFTLAFTLSIFRFLDLSFSSSSYNNNTFRYFSKWREDVGESSEAINPLVDLVQSFNFFDTKMREGSNFKLRNIAIKAVHHLHDWDFSLEYQFAPQLVTTGNVSQYQWIPAFAIQVKWIPVPEVSARMHQDNTGAFYLRE